MSTPGPPVLPVAPEASSQTLEFYWEPPLTNGGSPVTNYRIKLCNADTGSIVASNMRYFTTGPTLVNGTTYEAFIQACNVNGFGEAAYFRPFQPGSPPNPPSTISTIIVGTSNVLVTWTPPSVTPNATINWYALYARPVGATNNLYEVTADGLTQRNYLLSNFNTSCNYTFELSAVNGPGWSPYISSFLQFIIPPDYFEPTDLTSLQAWYDGADPLGTGTAPADGTSIATWVDKSGRGRNATGGTSVMRTNTLNSNPTITFSNNNFYNISYNSFPTSYSIFSVFRTTSSIVGGYQRIITASNELTLFIGPGGDGSTLTTFVGNGSTWNDININTPTQNLFNNYTLMSLTNNNTTLSPFANGSAQTTKTGTTISFNNFMIGRNINGIQQFYGNIAEINIYNQDLPTFYRQQTEGYLAWKWGLQSNLPATHPYRSTRPINPGLLQPTTAPNLSFWLDATRISTISSGTALTQWTDSTSNAYVGTACNGPVYQSTFYNGYMPAVTFNGTNQYIDYGDIADIRTSTISIFAVHQTNTGTGTLISKGNVVSEPGRWYVANDNSVSQFLGQTNTIQFNVSSNVLSNAPQLFNTNWDRLNANMYRNGALLSSVSGSNFTYDMNTSRPLFIGAIGGNGTTTHPGFNFNGSVGEILVFMSTPIESTRQKIEGYLSWKWGLTTNLPNQHPYKFYPPLSNYSSIAINTSTIFATNFNNGNDIGFTNFSNTNLISSQTITGSGAAYNFLVTSNTSVTPFITFSPVTTANATFCASVYRAASGLQFRGILYSLTQSSGILISAAADRIAYYWSNVGGDFDTGAAGTIPLNTWSHLALTVSPTEARFYINGSNIATRTASHPAVGFSNMYVGLPNANYFPGYIDNVRFYASTLTSNEVQAIYYNTQFI